uniref:Dihydropteridine reductase n=1 Tax=Euplotes harpa TaxID=151035 RepID=A0A7S3JMX9_9SPIT|mmetsp:Transcript_6998/g.7919  ORF Transcript_6998/g.7919 Transcript_6998/m.7919 type:complete len:230 (+) Transcript_6998:36-725(+)
MKSLLLVGGNGALGKAVVTAFKKTSAWRVASIDVRPNYDADANVLIDPTQSIGSQVTGVKTKLDRTYHSIICTAGGWAGGSVKDPEGIESFEQMHKACTLSALMAGHLATHLLAPKGLLVFTGAKEVYLRPAPSMIGYHLAKTATHAIAQNMATLTEIPSDCTVLTILPEVLDTPGNRAAMPDADFSTWANLEQVASLLKQWAHGENVPRNGSFVLLDVKNGCVSTSFK